MTRSRTAKPPKDGREKVRFGTRLASIMNRAAAVMSYRLHIAAANLWRDTYNPLRGLTIARAVTLLEAGERGEYADLQWTYRFIEMQDATLGALVERRTSAIQKMDWNIKVRDDIPEEKKSTAELQRKALRDAYERISNLSAAFEALAMASFRGYAHLEKVRDAAGQVTEFAPVDQWFWVREGIYGKWELNRDARFGVSRGEEVPLDRFIIREVARPINRVALVCFVRKAVSQKDWDGFIETFGIPAVFIVMPENVPADKEDEYLEAADQVSGDARGVLPGGSDVKTVDNGARGQNPFKEHIDYQDSQVVLRGTGGKLTMLNDATGLGSGQSSAHEKTFDEIARAEAAEISEILRKQFDAEVLASVTPNEPAYAYFELAANEETDSGEVVKDVVALNGAGYAVEEDFIQEKTGYPVRRLQQVTAPDPLRNRAPGDGWKTFKRETGTLGIPREVMPQIDQGNRTTTADMPVRNREDTTDSGNPNLDLLAEALGVRSNALAPVADLVDQLAKSPQGDRTSDAEWLQAVEAAAQRLPELFDPSLAEELAEALEQAMGGAALQGVRATLRETTEQPDDEE